MSEITPDDPAVLDFVLSFPKQDTIEPSDATIVQHSNRTAVGFMKKIDEVLGVNQ